MVEEAVGKMMNTMRFGVAPPLMQKTLILMPPMMMALVIGIPQDHHVILIGDGTQLLFKTLMLMEKDLTTTFKS